MTPPSPNAIVDLSPAPRTFWSRFFADWLGLDLRSLALARFGMGLIVFIDLLQRATSLRAHYTDDGLMPRALLIQALGDGLFWSLHNLSGNIWVVSLLFIAAAISSLMMMVGHHTRLATIFTWIFTVSIINRNPLVGQAGDVLLRLMLLWACFLPMGARWSIDSACNSKPRHKDNAFFSPATIVWIGQVCAMYWFAVTMKCAPTWLEGKAVYYALHCDMYTSAAGLWLRQFDGLFPMMTYSALALEFFGPLLAIVPFFTSKTRLFAVVVMVFAHVMFGVFLTVGIFSPIAIVLWLSLLPGGFWDSIFAKIASPARVGTTIFIDGNCGFCWRGVLVLRTIFLLPQTPIRTCQSDPEIDTVMRAENSWVVVDHLGRRHIRAAAAAHCFSMSPIGFPIAWLLRAPLLSKLADQLYRWIAGRRSRMSLISNALAPRPVNVRVGWLSGSLVMICFVLSILANIHAVDPNYVAPASDTSTWHKVRTDLYKTYDFFQVPIGILQLEQNWAMYAPSPLRADGWFIAEAFLSDGSRVDLLNGNSPVNWEKPAVVASTFPTHRWQKYLENMSRDTSKAARVGLCRYLCKTWNESHRETQRVLIIKFWFMKEETTETEILKPERVLLRVHRCSDLPNAIENVTDPSAE